MSIVHNKYARACLVGLVSLAILLFALYYIAGLLTPADEANDGLPSPKPYDDDGPAGVGALMFLFIAFVAIMAFSGFLATLIAPFHRITGKDSMRVSALAGGLPIVAISAYFWVLVVINAVDNIMDNRATGFDSSVIAVLALNAMLLLIGIAISIVSGLIVRSAGMSLVKIVKNGSR